MQSRQHCLYSVANPPTTTRHHC